MSLTTALKDPNILYRMRLFSIVLVALLSASPCPLWAQGQIVTSGVVCYLASPNPDFIIGELAVSPPLTSSDWLPQSQRSASKSSDVTITGMFQQIAFYETPITLADSSVSSQPALSVQAVPEPNSFGLFALAGLLIALCHGRKSAIKV